MARNICFFSVGFAFNRLVRLKYYESIFPKGSVHLLTTDRYKRNEESNYQHEWTTSNTIKHSIPFHYLLLPFTIRSFCKKNDIDVITNLGSRYPVLFLILSTLFTKTRVVLNIYGSIPQISKEMTKSNFLNMGHILYFYCLAIFSHKVILVDPQVKRRLEKNYFFRLKKRIFTLPATVNTDLFRPLDKKQMRKKLNISPEKKVIIFVGRVSKGKGSHVLYPLIENNPHLLFVVIGRVMDQRFKNLKKKNVIQYDKKSSEELVEFYNAADIGFFLQETKDGGLGLTAEEALASGIPAMVRRKEGIIEPSPALLECDLDLDQAQKTIEEYFSKNESQREQVRLIAREYALKHYAQKNWKEKYVNTYLNGF